MNRSDTAERNPVLDAELENLSWERYGTRGERARDALVTYFRRGLGYRIMKRPHRSIPTAGDFVDLVEYAASTGIALSIPDLGVAGREVMYRLFAEEGITLSRVELL